MNTELRLDHTIAGSNRHGKRAKDIRFTDLVKITSVPEINIRKACLEQANNKLQELIIAKQDMAGIYSKHRSKVPY